MPYEAPVSYGPNAVYALTATNANGGAYAVRIELTMRTAEWDANGPWSMEESDALFQQVVNLMSASPDITVTATKSLPVAQTVTASD